MINVKLKFEDGKILPAREIDIQTLLDVRGVKNCKITENRNKGNHDRYFAFLRHLLSMQEIYNNIEDLRVYILLKTGNYSEFITKDGEIVYIPDSMKFSKMDEITFKKLFNDSIDVAIQYFNLGITSDDFKRNIDSLLQFS